MREEGSEVRGGWTCENGREKERVMTWKIEDGRRKLKGSWYLGYSKYRDSKELGLEKFEGGRKRIGDGGAGEIEGLRNQERAGIRKIRKRVFCSTIVLIVLQQSASTVVFLVSNLLRY